MTTDPLAWLEKHALDLRAVNTPTGGGDFDVGWEVIEHHMAEPQERVIGRGRTPMEAMLAAGFIAPAQPAEPTKAEYDEYEMSKERWRDSGGTPTPKPPTDFPPAVEDALANLRRAVESVTTFNGPENCGAAFAALDRLENALEATLGAAQEQAGKVTAEEALAVLRVECETACALHQQAVQELAEAKDTIKNLAYERRRLIESAKAHHDEAMRLRATLSAAAQGQELTARPATYETGREDGRAEAAEAAAAADLRCVNCGKIVSEHGPCNCTHAGCGSPRLPVTAAEAEPKLPEEIHVESEAHMLPSYTSKRSWDDDDGVAYIERGRYTPDDLEAITQHLRHKIQGDKS